MQLLWILTPFVAAAMAPWLCRLSERAAPWLLAIVPFAIFLQAASLFPHHPQQITVGGVDWFPAFSVRFDYFWDGLSGLFTLLISGIGSLVIIYAGGYFGAAAKKGRILAYLLAFMGSMLGLVLADNLISLFVFWELTSVTSFLLIGYKHVDKGARDSALQALLVTGLGGLALLAGLLLLAIAGVDSNLPLSQAMQLSQLREAALQQHALYPAATILILLGAFTKSAQVPFHFWLPGAMAAPTPVSSYLHSATMVKAGIFLLARLSPILGGTTLWETSLLTAGGLTMLLGAALALLQRDLKLILAYSTVSVLGTLVFLLGIGGEAAIIACVVYLVAHALYKAALFQVAGLIDVKTGTRDILRLGGLGRSMPRTMIVATVAAVSMAGLPPLFGFYGKELLYGAALQEPSGGLGALAVSLCAASLTIVAALTVVIRPFGGAPPASSLGQKIEDASWQQLLAPALLAAASIVFGLAPFLLDGPILTPVATAIGHSPVAVKLALWHGLEGDAGLVVALSLLTFVAGGALWVAHRGRIERLHEQAAALDSRGAAAAYRRALEATYNGAARLTRTIQNGSLRRYIIVTVMAVVLAVGWPLLRAVSAMAWPGDDFSLRVTDLAIVLMMAAGVTFTALTAKRLSAVVSLGLSGLAVVLLFTMYSAPDLALTQVLIEVLTVILFMGVFYHVPDFACFSRRRRRLADLAVAAALGAAMSCFVLISQNVRLDPVLTKFFEEKSLAEAFGRNVVNVILVDFRAIDTMGEITVVAIAGFGVFALLARRRSRAED